MYTAKQAKKQSLKSVNEQKLKKVLDNILINIRNNSLEGLTHCKTEIVRGPEECIFTDKLVENLISMGYEVEYEHIITFNGKKLHYLNIWW